MARASKRIYEALRHLCGGRAFVAPRRESDDQALPYITHQMISDVPVNSLDGYTGHSRCRVQIDCYAATYGAAEELCQRVKMSVNNTSGAPLIDTATATFDQDTGLHRVSLDVFISSEVTLYD